MAWSLYQNGRQQAISKQEELPATLFLLLQRDDNPDVMCYTVYCRILKELGRFAVKRILTIIVILALLLSACQAATAERPPELAVVYSTEEYELQLMPESKPEQVELVNIPEYVCEMPLTWTDRINLIYEWLAIYDEEHRMAYDFTYDIRRPFEELTEDESQALRAFSMIFLTTFYNNAYGERWEEAMLARGHIRAGYDHLYSPVIVSAPDPGIVSNGTGAEHWVFPNLYAAFLYAGGYEAGFETLWEWENRSDFLAGLLP